MSKNSSESRDVNALKGLGLTDNDTKVYLHLLERGMSLGGSKIAARLGIPRQYVYSSLEKLMKLQLVEQASGGSRPKYQALPPRYLTTLARRHYEDIEKIARELDHLSAVGADQEFEFYRGTRQVMEFEERMVYGMKENETQYIIGGAAEAFFQFFDERYEEFNHFVHSKNLKSYYIGCPGEEALLERAVRANPLFEYRILQGMPKVIVDSVVRFDSVTFYSFGNPILVYILKSKVVADGYKQFFDMLWNMAPPRTKDFSASKSPVA